MAHTTFISEATPPTIELSDELTFQTASDMRVALLDAFEKAGAALCIDLSGVTSFDAAGVQLLYAASRTAEQTGTELSFEYGENAERFSKFFRFAGLRPLGIGADSPHAGS
jgi:anti-anti-sigma factor